MTRCRYCGAQYSAKVDRGDALRCPQCGAPGTEANTVNVEVNHGYTGAGYDIGLAWRSQSRRPWPRPGEERK